MTESIYGYCPRCYAKGCKRERRPDGNDECENGHTYKSINCIHSKHEVERQQLIDAILNTDVGCLIRRERLEWDLDNDQLKAILKKFEDTTLIQPMSVDLIEIDKADKERYRKMFGDED